MKSMARLRNGIGVAAALAASLLLAAAPGVSVAGDHGDSHGRGEGGHFERGGGPRGGGHFERGGGPRGGGHFERGGPHFGGRGGGGPRYAVPEHWTGMHPHWEGRGRWGDWDGDRHWVRP